MTTTLDNPVDTDVSLDENSLKCLRVKDTDLYYCHFWAGASVNAFCVFDSERNAQKAIEFVDLSGWVVEDITIEKAVELATEKEMDCVALWVNPNTYKVLEIVKK